jgi:two-component system chemotaxis sensor kinase CheA
MNAFEGLSDDFQLEAKERVDKVEGLLLELKHASAESRASLLDEAKRELHTLKGNSGMMGLRDLQAIAHSLEDATAELDVESPEIQPVLDGLDEFRTILKSHFAEETPEPQEEEAAAKTAAGTSTRSYSVLEQGSIRVPFSDLDELVDLLAEMVIFRNRLGNAIFSGQSADQANRAWDETVAAQESLKKTLGLIQDRVMQLRMVPLQSLFRSLQRIVHDESNRERRSVRLETTGGDTPMDKALLEVASEALGHLIRNAVVHGIEDPGDRVMFGKEEGGLVRLSASTHSNEVWMDVQDDGAGIDTTSLVSIAAARGLVLPEGGDPYSLLFQPGFTTKHDADLGAGRGMGLSAVQEAIQRLGGRIEVASEIGRGTRFRVKLPLNVSITRAMLMVADGEEYALPIASIIESLRYAPGDGHLINHAGVMRWRGEVIPIVDLGHIMGTTGKIRDQGFVVIIEAEGKLRGLVVDFLTGMKEIVVKGLDTLVGTPEGISGSTILGDGRVLLILDPRSLATAKPFIEERRQPVGAASQEETA